MNTVWLSGFRSTVTGEKVTSLREHCENQGIQLVANDYRGHGEDAAEFEIYGLGDWVEDARAVYRKAVSEKTIVVGSSMGGFIAMLLAVEALDRSSDIPLPGAFILIAPAIDMVQRFLLERMSDHQMETLKAEGRIELGSSYDLSPTVISKRFVDDGLRYTLVSKTSQDTLASLDRLIHIIHGADDPDVPLSSSIELSSMLPNAHVRMTIIPDGDHRLSRHDDIAALLRVFDNCYRDLSL